jgi:ribosome-binding factor A
MGDIKQKRAANQLQLALSELLRSEVNDPRVAGVTITEVRLDRELEHATIFVAALAGDEAQKDVLAGLASASGFLRRELLHRLPVRRVPVLHFHWDSGLARGERIAQLLDAIQPGTPQGEAGRAAQNETVVESEDAGDLDAADGDSDPGAR